MTNSPSPTISSTTIYSGTDLQNPSNSGAYCETKDSYCIDSGDVLFGFDIPSGISSVTFAYLYVNGSCKGSTRVYLSTPESNSFSFNQP